MNTIDYEKMAKAVGRGVFLGLCDFGLLLMVGWIAIDIVREVVS